MNVATHAPPAQAKGATILSTLAFVEAQFGADVRARVLARLAAPERAAIEPVGATDEVPLAQLFALWSAADAELRDADMHWIERSGAFSIESSGMQMYRGILAKSSPAEFLNQPVSLFRLYYQPGDMEVVEVEAGRAVLRLVGLEPASTLFCRRQTGGLLRATELAGGDAPHVRHVRCAAEGDAFCEWELRWRAPGKAPTDAG